MSIAVVAVILVAVAAGGVAAGYRLARHRRAPSPARSGTGRRILFPFTQPDDLDGVLESALRLAGTERATIIPTLLHRVPRELALDDPAGGSESELPPAGAIQQRVAAWDVPVDWRAASGRTYRDALRRLLAHEQFDRVVVSAADSHRIGLSGHDSGWLLEQAAEIVIVPPSHDAPCDAENPVHENRRVGLLE